MTFRRYKSPYNKTIAKAFVMLICSLLSYNCRQKNDAEFENFYENFDLFYRKGIDSIEDDGSLLTRKKRYYKIIYNNHRLDSLIIYNALPESKMMRLKASYNDSILILETTYPILLNDGKLKVYFMFNGKSAKRYTFAEDDLWDVQNIDNHAAFAGLTMIDSLDTTNIKDQLLKGKMFRTLKRPAFAKRYFSKKLDRDFTFNDWLNCR